MSRLTAGRRAVARKIKDRSAQEEVAAVAEDQLEAWVVVEVVDEDWEVVRKVLMDDEGQEHVTAASNARTNAGVETEPYDSGASRHMSPYRDRFVSYRTILPRAITAADKRVFYAVGEGDLRVEVPNGESSTTVLLRMRRILV